MTGSTTPDAAVLRWVQSIPAVRCAAPAFRDWSKPTWTKADDKPIVVGTKVNGLSLGSKRAAVETALGAARSKTLCGFDVARYEEPARVTPEVTSVGEMWFFYRNGTVAAIVRYEQGG